MLLNRKDENKEKEVGNGPSQKKFHSTGPWWLNPVGLNWASPGQRLLEKLGQVPAADVHGLRLALVDLSVDDDPHRRREGAAVDDDTRRHLEQLRDRKTFRQQTQPRKERFRLKYSRRSRPSSTRYPIIEYHFVFGPRWRDVGSTLRVLSVQNGSGLAPSLGPCSTPYF